jgi:hypothetical protein
MVAPEPPRRRCFARIRRSLRLPSQMNGVGIAFQPATASSNQVITSFAVFGCCPRKARSQMMRCIDSAIFSHDPLIGVYSGMIPCANNQVTMSVLKCPARLSQISSIRSGGSGRWGTCPNHVAQCLGAGASVSLTATSGSSSKMCNSSFFNQGCNTAFGDLDTPLARTSPVAGRNRVNSLAVPPRMYSCGWQRGLPSGCQD